MRARRQKALKEDILQWRRIFDDPGVLDTALTHKSYLGDMVDASGESNERLEFLGDAVLSIVTSGYLYSKHPMWAEGKLAKARSRIVCESSLAQAARRIDLGGFLRLGRGEEQSGGNERPSILSNALEAVFGAIYLDCGLELAQEFILKSLAPELAAADEDTSGYDYKSMLQERAQARYKITPTYSIVSETGKDHKKTFTAEVWIGDRLLGRGEGASKKSAEQAAAQQALERGIDKKGLRTKRTK
jgi:ribonuclease-3